MTRTLWAERKPGPGWQFSPMPDHTRQLAQVGIGCYRLEKKVLGRCRDVEKHLLAGGIETDTADQLHERGVRLHESLVEASCNSFLIDAIKRVTCVRRLLSYRSMQHRERYAEHAKQHLDVLDLLEHEKNEEASEAMRQHLLHMLDALSRISEILEPGTFLRRLRPLEQRRRAPQPVTGSEGRSVIEAVPRQVLGTSLHGRSRKRLFASFIGGLRIVDQPNARSSLQG